MIRLLLERFPLEDDHASFVYNPGRFIEPVELPTYVVRKENPFTRIGTTSRVIVVEGERGSGKTASTLHWANRLTTNWRWINLQLDDDDPTTFWGRNVRGFQEDNAPLWQEPTSYAELPDRSERPALLQRLEQTIREPLVVIWDDFECIRNLFLLRQFGRFVEVMPNNLRMVIITSKPYLIPLEEWNQLFEIDSVDLGDGSFSIPEAVDYLQRRRSQLSNLDAFDLARRIRRTPFELDEIIARLTRGDGVPQLVEEANSTHALGAESAHRHSFSRLPLVMQTFLVTTSILDWLSPQSCDLLTDRSDSKELLRNMHRLAIPFRISGQSDDWYSIEPDFREFLRKEFQSWSLPRKEHVLKRAISWYMTRGDEERALVLASEVTDNHFRLGVVWRAAPNMFATGAPELTDTNLDDLAMSVAEDHLQAVQVGAIIGNDDDSTTDFERLISDSTLDQGVRRDAFLSLACLAGQRGSNAAMVDYLARARQLDNRTGGTSALENLAVVIEQRMLRIVDENHDVDLAHDLALKAVSKTPLAPSAAPQTGLAFSLALQGRLIRAREALAAACETWNTSGAFDFPITSEIYFADALLQIEAGSFDTAEDLIEIGGGFLKYRGLRTFDAWRLGLIAEIHLGRDTPQLGLEIIDSQHNPRGYRPFGPELRGWLAERLIWLALRAGDIERARRELLLVTSSTGMALASARLALADGDQRFARSILAEVGPVTARREIERRLLLARSLLEEPDDAIAEISAAIDHASGEPLAATFRREVELSRLYVDPRLRSQVPSFAAVPIVSTSLRDPSFTIGRIDEDLIRLLTSELSLSQIGARLGVSSLEVQRRAKSLLTSRGLSTRFDLLDGHIPTSIRAN